MSMRAAVYLFLVALEKSKQLAPSYVETASHYALVEEFLSCLRKLPKLMPNHVLCHSNRHVLLSVVYLKPCTNIATRRHISEALIEGHTARKRTRRSLVESCMLVRRF